MIKKRGDEYDGIKKTLGHQMIEQVCKLYPQIKGHIDYVDIGSPVTNKFYIAQAHGEIYGLDHSLERFDLAVDSKLRPETDIPGNLTNNCKSKTIKIG
jgi:all-trans-retinol 13,14-reductase